jgi:hypothetical protein
MPLAVCADLSPADWLVASDLPWPRLVTFGPAGFAAYARVRFIPDPIRDGQQENEADLDASPDEVDQWRHLLRLLARDTVDPDDCYFGLWEGWGFPESSRRWPTFRVPRGAGPPARAYFLFHGSLSEAAIWGGAIPPTPESGAYRSSPEAVRRRSSGRRTTRGASPQTLIHTGQRPAHLRR